MIIIPVIISCLVRLLSATDLSPHLLNLTFEDVLILGFFFPLFETFGISLSGEIYLMSDFSVFNSGFQAK